MIIDRNQSVSDEDRSDARPQEFLDGGQDANQEQASAEPPAENGEVDAFADLERLRLPQDFAAAVSVQPVLTSIAVRKPHRQEFVRVRRGDEWKFETGCLTDAETREVYLVDGHLRAELNGDVKPTCLFLTLSRNSPVPFLWPVVIPGIDGRPCRWHESALAAAQLAMGTWTKVESDQVAQQYVPSRALGDLGDPEWPQLTLQELLRLAFRDRFIRERNHPILRRLRGEI